MDSRREPSFREYGIGKESSTPTGESSVVHKYFSSYDRERKEYYVENKDGSLIEREGLRYTADEQMIEEIGVIDPIVDEEELEVENVVRVQVGEEDCESGCDEM